MMRALEIVANSWPLAVMVAVIVITWAVRNLIKRDQDASNDYRREQLRGSHAVVVQPRRPRDDGEG